MNEALKYQQRFYFLSAEHHWNSYKINKKKTLKFEYEDFEIKNTRIKKKLITHAFSHAK